MTTPTEALIAEAVDALRENARTGRGLPVGVFSKLVIALESAVALDGERLEMIAREQERYVKDTDILFLARKSAERALEATLPRTVTTVEELDALGRVLALHKAEKRYYPASVNDHSFDSAEEAREWADSNEEDIEFFEICAECGRVESEQFSESGEEWGYRESLWPCKTITAIGDEAAGLLVTPTPEATA